MLCILFLPGNKNDDQMKYTYIFVQEMYICFIPCHLHYSNNLIKTDLTINQKFYSWLWYLIYCKSNSNNLISEVNVIHKQYLFLNMSHKPFLFVRTDFEKCFLFPWCFFCCHIVSLSTKYIFYELVTYAIRTLIMWWYIVSMVMKLEYVLVDCMLCKAVVVCCVFIHFCMV